MKNITILLFSLLSTNLYAQDFTVGFGLLSSQKYTEARQYFQARIDSYPQNITANICYGRALGLEGSAGEALHFFDSLAIQHPLNDEIKINQAEALMWNQRYTEARDRYAQLYPKHPDKTYLQIKYAENLSKTGEHLKAMEHIDTVFHTLGDSTASLSHKHIYLAAAHDRSKNRDIKTANILLDHALESHPDDGDVLLAMADLALQNQHSQKAYKLYTQPSAQSADSYRSRRGAVLALYQSQRYEPALELLRDLLATKAKSEDSLLASEIYLSLGMSSQAQKYFQTQNKAHTPTAIQLLQYQANPKAALDLVPDLKTATDRSLKSHELLVHSYSKKQNDSLLSSYLAEGGDSTAYLYRVSIQTQQVENYLHLGYTYGIDSDSGRSTQYETTARLRLAPRSYLIPRLSHKQTDALRGDSSSRASLFTMGYRYRPSAYFSLQADLGLNQYSTRDEALSIYRLSAIYRPRANKYLKFEVKKELQDFNTPLLESGFYTQGASLSYNYLWHQRLGWYSDLSLSTWNDQNTQLNFYNSLYTLLRRKPGLKSGLNLQYMQFSDQRPLQYFSPKSFLLTELFVELHKDVSSSGRWFYHAFGSYGYQQIADESTQTAYRLDLRFGYKIWGESWVSAFIGHSNAANTTASGFAYTTAGLRTQIYF